MWHMVSEGVKHSAFGVLDEIPFVALPLLIYLVIFLRSALTASYIRAREKMYPQHGHPMPPPQKPETFMLSTEAQHNLPHDAQVALQQVDNRMTSQRLPFAKPVVLTRTSEIFPFIGAC